MATEGWTLTLPDVPDYSGKSVEEVEKEFPPGAKVKFIKGVNRGTAGVVESVYGSGKNGTLPTLEVTITHYKRKLVPRHEDAYETVSVKPAFVEPLTEEEEEQLFTEEGNPKSAV